MTILVTVDTEKGEFRRYERTPTGRARLTHHACVDPEVWDDVKAGRSVFDHTSIDVFRVNPPSHMRVPA